MIDVKEGAFIFEKRFAEGARVERLMFCSDSMSVKDFERVMEIFRAKGFEPFLETHPKYGTCVVIVQRCKLPPI